MFGEPGMLKATCWFRAFSHILQWFEVTSNTSKPLQVSPIHKQLCLKKSIPKSSLTIPSIDSSPFAPWNAPYLCHFLCPFPRWGGAGPNSQATKMKAACCHGNDPVIWLNLWGKSWETHGKITENKKKKTWKIMEHPDLRDENVWRKSQFAW